ncbi:MAG: S8 family serine peptidase [Phycisphaerales bacterium]|nr:MAG: S8 family serine peptidase [Phycisphaerales bacterium]
MDEDHEDFDAIDAAGNAGASRVYNSRPGCDDHGTHVASIAGGNGFHSADAGFPAFSLRGHAPESEIGDYPHFNGAVQSHHDAIVNDDTDVTNHSYVQSLTVYDAEAASLDTIVRGDATYDGASIPAIPQVWACGNNGFSVQYDDEEGYYAVFTSAKNTISVGGVDTRDGRIYRSSSLGPTFDGRIKPDVVAPACNDRIATPRVGILAADCNSNAYIEKCGTSMAAPVVSAIIALMMEQYEDTYTAAPNLLPSTYRAMLIHTARDMIKTEAYPDREFDNPDTNEPVIYHSGPDFATGHGLVDADAARDIVTKSKQWKEATIGSTGQTHTWCADVLEGDDQLKVVIAWDDEAGDTTSGEKTPKLVNDLDLTVEDPTGQELLPWILLPLPLTATPGDGDRDPIETSEVVPARRGRDRRNNVETLTACRPRPGVWKVKVTGHNLPNGNTQPYSLVSSHPIRDVCFEIVAGICRRYHYRWLCVKGRKLPERIFVREEMEWVINPEEPVPIDEICKYVIDCPGCDDPAWGYCDDWMMQIKQVPVDAAVIIFNQKGKILVKDTRRSGTHALRMSRIRPGDQSYLLITDPEGMPYQEMLKVKFAVGP